MTKCKRQAEDIKALTLDQKRLQEDALQTSYT